MTINPSQGRQPIGDLRWLEPIARQPSAEDQNASVSIECAKAANNGSKGPNGSATPDLDLSKLISQLSRQLKQIEQTFMRALQSLVHNVEAGSAPAPPRRSARVSQSARPNPYDGIIRAAAQRNQLDPGLLSAVIRQESGFDPNARSNAGAMGLMQLMPDTARSLGVANAYDPAQNVEGGARMLRGLIDRYGGRLDLALAAYNAGSGAVDKYGGVPPYAETRQYVHAILAEYRQSALGA